MHPSEVGVVLAEHPKVQAVCVVGGLDPNWGELSVTFVAVGDAAAGLDESELSGWRVVPART